MCGRYLFTLTGREDRDIRDIINEVQQRFGEGTMKTGEIYPTNRMPVLVPTAASAPPPEGALAGELSLMGWGFPHFQKKGVIINARSETAHERPMFKRSLQRERCVVLSTGFFEWDANKRKLLFTLPGSALLFMAGLWHSYEGEQRFAILTRAAGEGIADIHDRMPVVLHREELYGWLHDPIAAGLLLRREPPALERAAV